MGPARAKRPFSPGVKHLFAAFVRALRQATGLESAASRDLFVAKRKCLRSRPEKIG